jgi:hypothetical protein
MDDRGEHCTGESQARGRLVRQQATAQQNGSWSQISSSRAPIRMQQREIEALQEWGSIREHRTASLPSLCPKSTAGFPHRTAKAAEGLDQPNQSRPAQPCAPQRQAQRHGIELTAWAKPRARVPAPNHSLRCSQAKRRPKFSPRKIPTSIPTEISALVSIVRHRRRRRGSRRLAAAPPRLWPPHG